MKKGSPRQVLVIQTESLNAKRRYSWLAARAAHALAACTGSLWPFSLHNFDFSFRLNNERFERIYYYYLLHHEIPFKVNICLDGRVCFTFSLLTSLSSSRWKSGKRCFKVYYPATILVKNTVGPKELYETGVSTRKTRQLDKKVASAFGDVRS